MEGYQVEGDELYIGAQKLIDDNYRCIDDNWRCLLKDIIHR